MGAPWLEGGERCQRKHRQGLRERAIGGNKCELPPARRGGELGVPQAACIALPALGHQLGADVLYLVPRGIPQASCTRKSTLLQPQALPHTACDPQGP